jgi:transposase
MRNWTAVGADVSARTIEVCVRQPDGTRSRLEVPNDAAGHRKLISFLTKKGRRARVCLEATGYYGLDLAVALSRSQRTEVMVLNPRAARRFAEAIMERSKTDVGDAEVLCVYAERMLFEPWKPPSEVALELRTLARRIHRLVQMKVEEKNRLHAARTWESFRLVRNDIEVNIRHLDRRIERLESQALELIAVDDELGRIYHLLITIRGLAASSAIRLLGELSVLPEGMTARQWVAHAGLDPRQHQSGTSVHAPPRISKAGIRRRRSRNPRPTHAPSSASGYVRR